MSDEPNNGAGRKPKPLEVIVQLTPDLEEKFLRCVQRMAKRGGVNVSHRGAARKLLEDGITRYLTDSERTR
jgi:hypothetical protein